MWRHRPFLSVLVGLLEGVSSRCYLRFIHLLNDFFSYIYIYVSYIYIYSFSPLASH